MFNWHDDSPGYGNNPNIFGGFITQNMVTFLLIVLIQQEILLMKN